MCLQGKSLLLSSIILLELLPGDDGTCRHLPFCAVARIRADSGYRMLPGRTGTSEQKWSKHRCQEV
jgi:hypothetical protein